MQALLILCLVHIAFSALITDHLKKHQLSEIYKLHLDLLAAFCSTAEYDPEVASFLAEGTFSSFVKGNAPEIPEQFSQIVEAAWPGFKVKNSCIEGYQVSVFEKEISSDILVFSFLMKRPFMHTYRLVLKKQVLLKEDKAFHLALTFLTKGPLAFEDIDSEEKYEVPDSLRKFFKVDSLEGISFNLRDVGKVYFVYEKTNKKFTFGIFEQGLLDQILTSNSNIYDLFAIFSLLPEANFMKQKITNPVEISKWNFKMKKGDSLFQFRLFFSEENKSQTPDVAEIQISPKDPKFPKAYSLKKPVVENLLDIKKLELNGAIPLGKDFECEVKEEKITCALIELERRQSVVHSFENALNFVLI